MTLPSPGSPARAEQAGQAPSQDSGVESAEARLDALERERAELLRAALAVAGSRSWRLSCGLSRLTRRLSSSETGTESALDTLIERLVSLELRHRPLPITEPAPSSPAAAPFPAQVDVVLWGATDAGELATSVSQARRTGAGRIILAVDAQADLGGLPDDPEIVAVASAAPRGAVADINAALRLSDAPLVALLRTGLTVPQDWLDRLREAAAEAREVGLVATAHDHGAVPLVRVARPAWLTPDAVSLLAGRQAGQRLRVSVFDDGCLAITRQALRAVGGLDPRAGDLQRAATEFAARLRHQDFISVLADDVVVRLDGAPAVPPRRRVLPRLAARRTARRMAPSPSARRHVQTELRSMLALEQRVVRAVAEPSRFAEELAATGRRPLSTLWIASTSSGPPRASAVAAAGEVAGLRALGFDASLAVAADEVSRLPRLDAEEALGFTDHHHLARLARNSDVLIATHPAVLPLLAQARPRRSGTVLACVFRALPQEPLPDGLDDLLLLAPSRWLSRRVGEEFGRPVEPFEVSADARYFHPKADDPAANSRLQVGVHIRPVSASQSVPLLERLAGALPPDISWVSFGPALATLDRHGVAQGGWREHHVRASDPQALARLLGRTDIMLDMARAVPTGELAAAAMACGAIPVVPRGSAAAEVVTHGRDGIVMTTANPDAWRDAVMELARDWPRLRSLQGAGIQSATRRTPLGTAVSQYLLFERTRGQLRRPASTSHPPAMA